MSGAMGMPPQGGQMPGMGQQQGLPQIPPQILAMLMAQHGGQGQQGMPSGQPPPQAMGTPQPPQPPPPQPPPSFPGVGAMAAQNPNLAMFGKAGQMGQGGPLQRPGGQQPRLTPAEMARLGRLGDQVVGHLTPGEIQVPPELQSPKVLAVLDKAFDKAGVSQQQFTAGSPQSSVNPNTGAPEYSLWSALLPIAGAVAGGFIGGPGGAAGGAAIGGALGGAAGGAIDHTGALGILGGAAGGAAGGYFGGGGSLGGLFGSGAADAAAAVPTEGIASAPTSFTEGGIAAGTSGGFNGGADLIGANGLPTLPPVPPVGGAPPAGVNWQQLLKGGMGAGMGAGLLGGLAGTQPSAQAALPPGFNTPMHPIDKNGVGRLLGNNQSSQPNFTNYDPIAAVSGNPFRFFPIQQA